jgi:hypothetical protein
LQEANPELGGAISRLNEYLVNLKGEARLHITASDVAQAIGESRKAVVGLLMAATRLGLLKLKFRLSCAVTGAGIRDFDDLEQIPKETFCGACGESHAVSPDDVEYFFELNGQTLHSLRK